MLPQQLHLFESPRPLEQRLGARFFSEVPRSPGVYIMTGTAERVLYIGQSANLRSRLNSYKNAKPDRAPRKVIRLVHEVRQIVWERCDSADAAKMRESELLQLHRPKFNRVGTFQPSPWYLAVNEETSGLRIARERSAATGYGPFPGGIAFHGALVRCAWANLHLFWSPAQFPAGVLSSRVPPVQQVPWTADTPLERSQIVMEMSQLLKREGGAFLSRMQRVLENLRAPWLLQVLTNDVDLLGLLVSD